MFGEDKMFYSPAVMLENVIDPTGAGDSFAGGFIGYLAKTKEITFDNMKKAVVYGTVLASFTVEKLGIESIENIEEEKVNKRLAEIRSVASF